MAQAADEIKSIRDLKPLLISDIQATYGPEDINWNRFDITTSSRTDLSSGKPHTYITAQAIVYTNARVIYGKWVLLAKGEERDTVLGAYLSLWSAVQAEMGRIVEKMGIGATYRGK